MAQFTLIWNSIDLQTSTNSLAQRVLYRYKTVGGGFISTGFSLPNDLAITINTVESPILDNNKVIEFKVQNICTENGPTDNDNGIQEVIALVCLVPVLTKTTTTGTISIDLTGLDIIKVKFTLKKASDNTIVGTPIIVNKTSNSAGTSATGLTSNTNYYWQTQLYSVVNNVEVISEVCSPHSFTTDPIAVCDPITAITVTSIEIP